MVISARESIFSSGPRNVCKVVHSYTFRYHAGKNVHRTRMRCVYMDLAVPAHCTAWQTVQTNHKSFYSLLTLCARVSERENKNNENKIQKPIGNERARVRATVSQRIQRFDNQFRVETNVLNRETHTILITWTNKRNMLKCRSCDTRNR